ncbi:DUF1697 domain-containing protein [Confluentibacter flavum]|uniref:DUF1697 domain-containing protein n=1 Tax=Confluentibacter flavum TaxID=1909700 RepID=A0A2N3HFC1_9FLAO|nr:DUF1697 domain-containing protein [Confluentibacter flavum]PKQ43679.1 hypothetical protein CSW08_16880 [Confluentibacter flavum]
MKTYIALLRGINVGGHKKVPMATLRELLTTSGLKQVQTYIQSGNVIFKSQEEAHELEETIKKSILDYFGFEVFVIIKTPNELQTILNDCPFPKDKMEKSFFVILSKIPDTPLVKEVQQLTYENEEIIIKKDALYFYCSTGYGQSKFNMNTFERKLNVIGTSRNYNTMVKLLSLSGEID